MSDKYKPYDLIFKKTFLLPKFWPVWFGVFVLYLLAFMPVTPRDKFARFIATKLFNLKLMAKRKKIAKINLSMCFPEMDDVEQDRIIMMNLVTFCQTILSYAEPSARSLAYNRNRMVVHGGEHLFPLLEQGKPCILLVPHTFAIDFSGLHIVSYGAPFCSMFNDSGNEFFDCFMTRQRTKIGGSLYHRKAGLGALVYSLKKGESCYYLPDEDHGPKRSVFAPLFATQKATLPVLGKLAQKTNATVVPMYAAYNEKLGKFETFIRPAMQNFPSESPEQDAVMMNKEIEALIECGVDQYMWTLRLLRTRPDGKKIY
ncbi:MAG: lauroyl-Kdo(2)-lipid IV(A) myristoyltransferase [Saccharospirillaceae bacterium]|nr:lauroyl-Kdo(2)-lipid IV(A) myristoyltransferase [Saccharospirillaceae bacterium]